MTMTPIEYDDRAPDEEIEADPADDPIELGASFNEREIADEVIERIAAAEKNLYQRNGSLVRILVEGSSSKVIVRSPKTPRIVPLSRPNLREIISARVAFSTHDRGARVPEWLVRAISDRAGDWDGIRRLRAVVDTPVLRGDGTIIDRTGYDEETELHVMTAMPFRVPESPTLEDAQRARDDLLEVVCDFPFERPEHRAAWIAALLTPFARYAFEGPTPLVAIDKNVRGAGGTLLADAIGVIVSGRKMPRTFPANDVEEERKRITSIALTGDPLVLIDNVAGTLGTSALDAALTGTEVSDRLLGTNVQAKLALHVTWFATGNNLEFGADTLRRVMHVRLASPHERPEERSDFKHPDLLAWILSERSRLVTAALTVLRAYCVAGRPKTGMQPWGSYEAWSDFVRGAVVWCGLPDPARTREELTTAADSERNALHDLLVGWHRMFGDAGGTVGEALAQLEKSTPPAKPRSVEELSDPHDGLRAALAEICPTKAGTLPTAAALGKRLRRHRGRVVGGYALDGRKGKAGIRWVARKVVSKGDDGDVGDDVSPPSHKKKILKGGSTSSPSSPDEVPLRRRSEVRRTRG